MGIKRKTMINQLRFLKVICLLAVILGAPCSLWFAATGRLMFAIITAVVVIAAFTGFIISKRSIRMMKEMEYHSVDDDIKPV